eukprot:TRINITY_DN105027_c0_g1_i3.p1 TRINITY_DN105027_c0_g1~~TRINITY_DN105027_c0_g1_i3.p1  ORF type:complete len:157 (-),score=21.89 TRINITY_DN105027_c0_g1_i3:10-480(-)
MADEAEDPKGLWECPVCFIKNKPDATHCPDCGGGKPDIILSRVSKQQKRRAWGITKLRRKKIGDLHELFIALSGACPRNTHCRQALRFSEGVSKEPELSGDVKRMEFLMDKFYPGDEVKNALHCKCRDNSLFITKSEIGRAVQQECRDRSRMPSSA